MSASDGHPWDVERQWQHDLGVAEGVESLTDEAVSQWRELGDRLSDVEPGEDVCMDGLDAVAGGEDTDTDSVDIDVDVPAGSEAAQLLEKLESVTGWSLEEWLQEYGTRGNNQVWHVPAWLAEENYMPLHDSELGTLVLGSPHHETDAAIKFDDGVEVLMVETTERCEYRERGRVRVAWQDLLYKEMDSWQDAVESCVGDDDMSSSWTWRYVQTGQYWPFSQITRIY